jgi:hypothetical protein
MNKLSKQASNSRTAKLSNEHRNPVQAAPIGFFLSPVDLFVYERCCARREKLSSARGREKRRCRLIAQVARDVCS